MAYQIFQNKDIIRNRKTTRICPEKYIQLKHLFSHSPTRKYQEFEYNTTGLIEPQEHPGPDAIR